MKSLINKILLRLSQPQRTFHLLQWKLGGWNDTLRLDYDLAESATVLDLGGYLGDWADGIRQRSACKIHVFEPVEGFAKVIEERFTGDEALEVHRFGLGARDEELKIRLAAEGSSTFRDVGTEESIKIVDVNQWLEDHSIERIDLMKVNIEGGEYELIEALIEKGWIERIVNLQVQFHDILDDGGLRMEKIHEELTKTHKPTFQYRFIWENWCRRD